MNNQYFHNQYRMPSNQFDAGQAAHYLQSITVCLSETDGRKKQSAVDQLTALADQPILIAGLESLINTMLSIGDQPYLQRQTQFNQWLNSIQMSMVPSQANPGLRFNVGDAFFRSRNEDWSFLYGFIDYCSALSNVSLDNRYTQGLFHNPFPQITYPLEFIGKFNSFFDSIPNNEALVQIQQPLQKLFSKMKIVLQLASDLALAKLDYAIARHTAAKRLLTEGRGAIIPETYLPNNNGYVPMPNQPLTNYGDMNNTHMHNRSSL
jgi:hypothetical protein